MNIFLFVVFLTLIQTTLFSEKAQTPKLIVMRHGQADNNIENIYNSNPDYPGYKPVHLTEKGKLQIQENAKELLSQGFNNTNIDAVYVSPLPRTRETAEILSKEGLFAPNKIIVDDRIIEHQAGNLEGKKNIVAWRPEYSEKYQAKSLEHMERRIKEFYQFLLQKHYTGNIIVVTHALDALYLTQLISGSPEKLTPGQFKILPLYPEK